MTKSKEQAYLDLISQMKLDLKFSEELANPHHHLDGLEKKYVDPWEQWQNDLNAEIMIIGQDFANEATFLNENGMIEPNHSYQNKEFLYPTNERLYSLMKEHLIDIGHPHPSSQKKVQSPVFITNAVMGLKRTKSMSTPIKKTWLVYYRDNYLKQLIELVSPKIIITIGRHASFSVLSIFKIDIDSLNKLIENPPDAKEANGIKIFPVAHTGALAQIRRSKDVQNIDWKRIGEWYQSNIKPNNINL